MDQPLPFARPLALLVEDETIVRMQTADLLLEAGFEVLEAWNVVTGLRQFERRPGIELLITDVRLPGARDGFALAREVAARWPDVAIVVLSGVAAPGPDDLPAGVRFIPKRLNPRLVLETVQAITGRGAA